MDIPPPNVVYVPGIDLPYYFSHLIDFFTGHSSNFYGAAQSLIGVIVAICIPLTFLFLVGIVIVVEGLKKIRDREDEIYMTPQEKPEKKEDKAHTELAARWKKVMEHVDSHNQNDWKQAIIEADVMLENLVTKLGYLGESLGEKLKRTTKGDFKSRDAAWEAHLVRNRIAHDGSEYDINQVEAKRIISLYRQVFDEFYHISE